MVTAGEWSEIPDDEGEVGEVVAFGVVACRGVVAIFESEAEGETGGGIDEDFVAGFGQDAVFGGLVESDEGVGAGEEFGAVVDGVFDIEAQEGFGVELVVAAAEFARETKTSAGEDEERFGLDEFIAKTGIGGEAEIPILELVVFEGALHEGTPAAVALWQPIVAKIEAGVVFGFFAGAGGVGVFEIGGGFGCAGEAIQIEASADVEGFAVATGAVEAD